MVLVQVLRNGVGVHLDVWELGGVSLEVDLEVALCGEPRAADIALEGSLTSVRPDVDLEGGIGSKDLSAVPAAMLEEGLSPPLAVVRDFVLAEGQLIGQVPSEQTLRGRVEHLLGALLQHLQGVGLVQRRWCVVVRYDGGGQRGANVTHGRLHGRWNLIAIWCALDQRNGGLSLVHVVGSLNAWEIRTEATGDNKIERRGRFIRI